MKTFIKRLRIHPAAQTILVRTLIIATFVGLNMWCIAHVSCAAVDAMGLEDHIDQLVWRLTIASSLTYFVLVTTLTRIRMEWETLVEFLSTCAEYQRRGLLGSAVKDCKVLIVNEVLVIVGYGCAVVALCTVGVAAALVEAVKFLLKEIVAATEKAWHPFYLFLAICVSIVIVPRAVMIDEHIHILEQHRLLFAYASGIFLGSFLLQGVVYGFYRFTEPHSSFTLEPFVRKLLSTIIGTMNRYRLALSRNEQYV